MDAAEALTRFRAHLSREAFDGARYAMVACTRDGELHNVSTRVTWLPSRKLAAAFRSSGHGIEIAAGWLSLRDSIRFLETLPDGRGTIAEHCISFRDIENNRPYGIAWEHDETMWSQSYIGWSGHCLVLSGPQMGSLLRNPRLAWLGDRLGSLRPDRVMSWRDVERILGPKSEISDSRACGIELFAPVMVKLLAPIPLLQSTLVIPVESFLDPAASQMELIVQESASGAIIATIPGGQWKRAKGRIWEAALESGLLRGAIDLTLNVGELKVWRSTIALPGLTARILDGLEGGSGWLERLLLPTINAKKDSAGFERAVVSLLALGGFPAIPIGHGGPDRSSDLICAVSEHHVLLGECTLGPIAPRKVGEIRHRAEEALSRLQRPGESLATIACVFTPVSYTTLPAEHLSMADQSGTIVIWRERLAELLTLARSDELRFQLWELLEQWRPKPIVPLPLHGRRRFR